MAENDKNANYNIHPYQTDNWVNASLERNKYRFLLDSRYGGGAYQNGKYLIPHKREDQNDYDIRRSKSAYNNQYQAILNAHYKPIFKNKAKRVIKEDTPQSYLDLYESFLNNADGKGNSLQKLMERSAGDCKNLGASFLVMNNDIDIDSSIEDVIDKREGVPYAFIVTPDVVYQYETDSFGNLISLEWYQQNGSEIYDKFGYASDSTSGFPTSPNTSNDANGEQIIVGVNLDSWYIVDGENRQELAPNTIGMLPVVRLVEDESDDIIPMPSLYGVARMQNRLFNLSSIITDISDNQAFSIFTYPSFPNSGLEYSTTKGIGYPADSSNKPEFISPDATQLKTLMDLESSLVNMMYQAGVVSHLQRFQQSAESKEIDRARLNDLLGTFKYQIEQSEEKLMMIFGEFVGYDYDYIVLYSEDFGVSTLTERIDRFNSLDATKISSTLYTKLEQDLAEAMLKFGDEEEKDQFLDDIAQEREQAQRQLEIDTQF